MAKLGQPSESFFVSYTRADERWAEWIGWQLEQAGHCVRLMAWDFRPGTDFVAEMHKALQECDRTLIVLSPAYLKSAFCQPEWTNTFASDPTGEHKKLLPVRIADCQPDGLLKTRVYVELAGLADEATARQKLLAGISPDRAKPATAPAFPGAPAASAASARLAPAFPGDLPPVWNVPFPPNPCFTGRQEALDALHERLTSQSTAAITQPQAVHGLGGVGKTQLAVEYSWQHRADYDAVLWVGADSPENLAANLAALARPEVLNLPEAAAKEQPVQTDAVLRWLHQHRRWLLVLDSADSPEAAAAVRQLLSPPLPGHVIVTSRHAEWPMTVRPLEVDSLPDEAAADFLLARTGAARFEAGPRADALTLARELGGLPLALEQAAAYVLRHRVTFASYLDRLKAIRPQLLREEAEGGTRYPRSVAETWLATEEQLCLTARAILRLAAFLAPDEIPRDLVADDNKALAEAVRALAGEEGPVAAEATRFKKNQSLLTSAATMEGEAALVELAAHSMITLEPGSFCCHRLVQAVQSDRLTGELRRRWTELAARWVDDGVPVDSDDVRTWPVMESLRSHIEAVASQADHLGIAEPTPRLMSQLGVFLWAKALHREAEPLMRRALAIDENSFGPDHPKVAIRLNNLATLLQATNRLAGAEQLMRRALAIDEKSFGPDHPAIATRLNNLASLLKATNRLAEAEPLMRRVLDMDEKSFGPDHPDVATALNNLASLLKATNRLAEAEPLMRRVLAIDEKALGPDHPDVATALNNLASLLLATNRLVEAEPLMRRALATDEKSFGPDHPKVARDLNNLAQLLQATNRLAEAEPLMRRALAVDEKNFGSNHSDIATDLNNLAMLLQDTKRLGEAEPLMRRALAIGENSFGPDHPNVALCLNNLARLLQDTNRQAKAEPLMRRNVVIFRSFGESTGYEHPHMQKAIRNYTRLLKAMGLSANEIQRRVTEAAGKFCKRK